MVTCMTAPESSDGVTVKENVTYREHPGPALQGDLYLPKGQGPFPILIGVPGGGWRICVRASLRDWGFYLASRGYAMFVIDYRLATTARKAFPEAVQDVIAAIRFVRGSSGELSIDPNRIGLLGASAGAHLAALAALGGDAAFGCSRPGNPLAGTPVNVKALIAIYGVYDLVSHWRDDLRRNPDPEWNLARNLMGKDPYEDPRAWFEASPLGHVSYDKNQMPVFVSWGGSDDVVDPGQSEAFVRALQQARFTVRTHRIPAASHFWFSDPLDDPTSDSANLAPRLMRFMRQAV
jgi:acetyl esterase/lipase